MKQSNYRRQRRQMRYANGLLLAATLGTTGLVMTSAVAKAETITSKSNGQSVEAAWTTCPARPAVATTCNYTAVYAAKSNTFQRFITISLANLRVYPTGYVEILASATGYAQPAASMSVTSSTSLASAATAGAVYLYGDCGNPGILSTCYYYGTAALSAQWSATAGKTTSPGES